LWIDAFRANDSERIDVFFKRYNQELLSRKQLRDRYGVWAQIKDGLTSEGTVKRKMAQALSDGIIGIARPAYEKFLPRYHVHLCSLNVLRVGLAVKLYQRGHKGLLPSDLGQLVPDYLATIPQDSFNGFQPLHYVRRGKHFLVYSFGPDGKDDHGSAALDGETYMAGSTQNTGDIIFAD
jgi:hypothetical protein